MPEIMFAMIYILSIVLCFAVGVMLSYHLYGISWGETSVEAQDHEEYRKKAKQRNEVIRFSVFSKAISLKSSQDFVNSYDIGFVQYLLCQIFDSKFCVGGLKTWLSSSISGRADSEYQPDPSKDPSNFFYKPLGYPFYPLPYKPLYRWLFLGSSGRLRKTPRASTR